MMALNRSQRPILMVYNELLLKKSYIHLANGAHCHCLRHVCQSKEGGRVKVALKLLFNYGRRSLVHYEALRKQLAMEEHRLKEKLQNDRTESQLRIEAGQLASTTSTSVRLLRDGELLAYLATIKSDTDADNCYRLVRLYWRQRDGKDLTDLDSIPIVESFYRCGRIDIVYRMLTVDWCRCVNRLPCFVNGMDALYEAGRYEQCLQVWESYRTNASASLPQYPIALLMLYCAACYQLGTRQYLDLAMQLCLLVDKYRIDRGWKTAYKALMLTSALALKLDDLEAASKLLALYDVKRHKSSMGLYLMTMARLGHFRSIIAALADAHANGLDTARCLPKGTADTIEWEVNNATSTVDSVVRQQCLEMCHVLRQSSHPLTAAQLLLSPTDASLLNTFELTKKSTLRGNTSSASVDSEDGNDINEPTLAKRQTATRFPYY